MSTEAISRKAYTDVQGLSDLKRAARAQDPAAVRETARQFETQMRLLQTAESNDRSAGQLLSLQG